MSGPGRPGAAVTPYDAQQLAVGHAKVVKLCVAGVSTRRVSDITKYSKTRVAEIYARWRAQQNLDECTQHENRIDTLAEIQLAIDVLKPWVTDPAELIGLGEVSPSANPVRDYLAAIDRKAKLLGTDAPKESIVHQSPGFVVGVREHGLTEQEVTLKAIAALNGLARQPGQPEPYLPMTALEGGLSTTSSSPSDLSTNGDHPG
jgi:hypothetical protein